MAPEIPAPPSGPAGPQDPSSGRGAAVPAAFFPRGCTEQVGSASHQALSRRSDGRSHRIPVTNGSLR